MQSWVSVALRRVCVEPVNWCFLQSDAEKSWRWQKKISPGMCLWGSTNMPDACTEHLPANRTTVRPRGGWRRTAKPPWRLWRCESLQQLRWEWLCWWLLSLRQQKHEDMFGRRFGQPDSLRGFFFNVFSRFNTGVQPVTQTRRRCVCSRLTWTFWFVQFWEEEWRTTAVSRCGGVTETCLIKPSDAIKS